MGKQLELRFYPELGTEEEPSVGVADVDAYYATLRGNEPAPLVPPLPPPEPRKGRVTVECVRCGWLREWDRGETSVSAMGGPEEPLYPGPGVCRNRAFDYTRCGSKLWKIVTK